MMALKNYRLFFYCLFAGALLAVVEHAYWQWDFANYHWYNAYAFLHGRLGFDIAPAQMQTYFNPWLDVFNYVVMQALVYTPLYEAVFGLIWGVNFFIFIKIAERLLVYLPKNLLMPALIFAALIGISGPDILPQIGVAFTDPQVDVFVLLAFYCGLHLLDAPLISYQRRYAFMIGLCLGLALGLKLTTMPYLFALLMALVCCASALRQAWVLFLLLIAGFALSFLAMEAYWMWKLYALFQNPFFPMFNNFFHSPYASFTMVKDDRYLPQSLWQWLFYPFFWVRKNHWVTEQPCRDWRFAVLFILSTLCLLKALFCRKTSLCFQDRLVWRFLIVFMFFSYVSWLYLFSIYRYLIPAALFSGIALVAAALYLLESLQLLYKMMVLVALTLLFIFTSFYPIWGRLPLKIEVSVPAIAPQSLVILVTPPSTQNPSAYLIPYFPHDARFVSAYNNFMTPGAPNLLQKQADQLILNYPGPRYVIESPKSPVVALLKAYGLYEVSGSCQVIGSNLEKPGTFKLCVVTEKTLHR